MSAKVIPLWRPRTFTSAEAMLDEVRVLIHQDGRTQKRIADAVGVSQVTVGNIASGKTKWPRHTTLFPLMAVLGYKFTMTKE
jgi:transcriptional regulator with XRE-family HTH domain